MKYQMISSNVGQNTTVKRKKAHSDRFTFEHLKNTKMCFTTWGLNIFLQVQEGEDGKYTETYYLSEHEDGEQREKKLLNDDHSFKNFLLVHESIIELSFVLKDLKRYKSYQWYQYW